MQSDAKTVAEYLDALDPDRREAISAVRHVILKSLPQGFVEVINWGMITYEVPLATKPDTYNGQPLMYAALASQKNHMAVYLCSLSCMPETQVVFETAWVNAGKKLDMGKSCVRFKKLEQLDLQIIGDVVASTSVEEFVSAFETKANNDKHKRQSSKRQP